MSPEHYDVYESIGARRGVMGSTGYNGQWRKERINKSGEDVIGNQADKHPRDR